MTKLHFWSLNYLFGIGWSLNYILIYFGPLNLSLLLHLVLSVSFNRRNVWVCTTSSTTTRKNPETRKIHTQT